MPQVLLCCHTFTVADRLRGLGNAWQALVEIPARLLSMLVVSAVILAVAHPAAAGTSTSCRSITYYVSRMVSCPPTIDHYYLVIIYLLTICPPFVSNLFAIY